MHDIYLNAGFLLCNIRIGNVPLDRIRNIYPLISFSLHIYTKVWLNVLCMMKVG